MNSLSFNKFCFVSGLLLLLFGRSQSNAQSLLCEENDAFEIDCTPTLYQVYDSVDNLGNHYTRLFSYDNSSGVSVTIDYEGEYNGTINATGYSAARNRAYGIGCRNNDIPPTGNPNGVCPNPRLVEITMDYSVGPIPEARFCDVPLLLSNNCGGLGRFQQGDVVPCNLDGIDRELFLFSGPISTFTPNSPWVYITVLDPLGLSFVGSSAVAGCFQFDLGMGSIWDLETTADFAFDPDVNALFHVVENGTLAMTTFANDLTSLTTNQITSQIGTSFFFNPTQFSGASGWLDATGTPIGGPFNPTQPDFGAVYIAQDVSGKSRILCTNNISGVTYRSTENTHDILNNGVAWNWQEIDVDTKDSLQNNDGFSCPTAPWVSDTTITCDGPLGCSFNLQLGTANSEDSCRFVASIPTGFDVSGNPEPVPYDCKWIINYGGGTLVYNGYNLNSIEFEIPKSSYPNKEICLTLTCPTNPAQTITCCQDLECSGTCNVNQDDVMECNLYKLPGDDCCHSIHPSLPAGSSLNPEELCLYIDWGDGGPLEFQTSFNSTYTHCYETSGGGCNVPSHEITVYAFCCPDQEDFLEYYNDEQAYPYAMSCSACANCCPVTEVADDIDCYIRNAFWMKSIEPFGDDACLVTLGGTQFLGPDMIQHFSPLWWAPNNDVVFLNNYELYTNVQISAPPGTYSICRSIQGLAIDYSECSTQTCHDIPVSCAVPCEEDMCPEDLDGDGMVSTSDLLMFLSAFGAECN